MLASSGFSEYDAEIMPEMRAWKFKPVAINGEPTAVCAPVAIAYTQQ